MLLDRCTYWQGRSHLRIRCCGCGNGDDVDIDVGVDVVLDAVLTSTPVLHRSLATRTCAHEKSLLATLKVLLPSCAFLPTECHLLTKESAKRAQSQRRPLRLQVWKTRHLSRSELASRTKVSTSPPPVGDQDVPGLVLHALSRGKYVLVPYKGQS